MGTGTGVAGAATSSGVAGSFNNVSAAGYALKTNGRIRLAGIGEAAGKVLTSDAAGNATWQTPSGSGNVLWSKSGTVIAPTQISDQVAIGTNTINGNEKLLVYQVSNSGRSVTAINNHTSTNWGALTATTYSPNWFAATFNGSPGAGGKAFKAYGMAEIEGNFNVTGSMSKGSGTFKIDHPLDPANKYLYHSFVESPDMMNIYNGNITTDGNGYATVTMPEYFNALNKDFRYQLTVIDNSDDFVQAKIVSEINGNYFRLRTSKPNIKVSWQVTGVRQDKFANAHRVVPEVEKEAKYKGKYLHPEEWGRSASDGIGTVDVEGGGKAATAQSMQENKPAANPGSGSVE